ncbi:hypothetical protein ACHHYP_02818 [Achlya hypogyna]|uniref:Secreted protein n=1 Tax=Achlya hypogyna TaxID=1202772 RepID=A0A1V9ZRW5_ACHHY|nr:hypothetical protein ACHHYP_02818 [Achlya hypogyna]
MKTLAALATVSVGATAISLYVDPALGNDISNDGSLAHPFQSIPKAQAAVRDLLRAQQIAGTPAPIDVILRGGTHVLSSTLTFGPQDSGSTALNRVSYKAYCNPTAPSDLTVLPYPYVMNTTTELRDLWNGVSSPASWTGPADPLAQLGIRPSSTPSPPVVLPPVCFDLVGVGHTCYTVEAPCVSDCMTACQRNVDKRVYSTAVYDQFYLLFGRDLRNEDECNGLCARMCTTCEQFFDAATAMLYVIPPVGVNLQTSTISFPVLKQLVQVQGTPGIDVAFSVPGYYTILTAGETETAAPAPQVGWTSHLTFDGITFTGTLRSEMELYEALPGHPWTQTRVAAVYIESADDIIIQRSTFRQIGGNTIVISARNQGVQVVHNHFYSVGATAVAVLPRGVTAFPNIRSFEFMNTIASNISYNQMHDYGQVTTQSAAILLLAANRTTVKGNLVFAIPTGGVSYSISNANGDETKPGYLVRPLAAPITLPVTLATSLATNYTTVVDIGRFDISVVAKIIGAPICPPSQGRVGALYGQQHSACSGCCRTTSGTASIQNTALGSQSLLAVALRPGDQLQLQVTSAPYFEAPVDVYVGFHIVTPNRLVEIPAWRFVWQVKTRPCTLVTTTQVVACGGPCGCPATQVAANLVCSAGYDPIPTSLGCTGPFDSWSSCNAGALARVLYYNCTMTCTSTVCS